MISFPGYDDLIKKIYDEGQEHVFFHWDSLTENEKQELLDDLADVDFKEIKEQFEKATQVTTKRLDYSPADYIRLPKTDEELENFAEARETGIAAIKKGRVCTFIVAGGQGSRLGYDGPKGAYEYTPVKHKSLFQLYSEKILKNSELYDVEIPLLIMTSNTNHKQTLEHFESNNYFGLSSDNVFMFKQDMIPSLTTEGKLILRTKSSLFRNPNGHGGSLIALKKSGVLEKMKKRGIDLISYFQVDNPMVCPVDPAFIGFHIQENAEISSKALTKAYPQEKVGNFVVFSDNTLGIVEYSDLPDDKAYEKDDNNSLRYSAGNLAIHIFSVDFILRITSDSFTLPFHLAEKKITSYNSGEPSKIEGYKFEKFVFDALPLTDTNVIMEASRRNEFAPVKNRTGLDSVDSSRQLMMDLHRGWLEERGIKIPDSVAIIEISPLVALGAEDLDPDITIPDKPEVYIG
ncbi:MAG: UTP--glucose-1-phosphate uridylyltransferase [Spirochaetes bacterium]|jgi:UDP-N-acetylglucosamine/UDP-N-acetylgalactosamine diphosphorylase|nr:UTP--glucose-1-phosphate uridylyltransferase [Spirochaetota bacterium]